MYIYVDGRFIEEKEATIPISDRGFLFGDGVFTTIKVLKQKALYIDEHLAKLSEEMERFAIEASITKELIFDFIRRNKLEDARLKVIVTGGDARELALPRRRGRVVMISNPWVDPPSQIKVKAIKLPIFPGKLLSYMPRLYLREIVKPCDDALLLTESNEIVETAFGNVYWEYEGELFTPDSTKLPLYKGVSIQVLAKTKRVHAVCMKLDELPKGARLFRINSSGVSSLCLETGEQSLDLCLTKAHEQTF